MVIFRDFGVEIHEAEQMVLKRQIIGPRMITCTYARPAIKIRLLLTWSSKWYVEIGWFMLQFAFKEPGSHEREKGLISFL